MPLVVQDIVFVAGLLAFFAYLTATVLEIADKGSIKTRPAYWPGLISLALLSASMVFYVLLHTLPH
jgi:hypothetical protein